MAVEGKTAIRFQGPPAKLEATVTLPREQRPFIRLRGEQIPLRAFGDARQITTLTFSMPDETAPGESTGEVVYGEVSHQAVVQVLARSRVNIASDSVSLRAARGDGTLKSDVDVRNIGNAAVALQEEQIVTLRPAGALARSVRRAFADSERDLSGRLIELGRHLAAEELLEIPVQIASGAPTLAPGARTRVSIAATAPPDLQPGTVWTGRLAIYDQWISITLEQES